MIQITKISKSTNKNKKYVATLNNNKQIHFGLEGSNTYTDSATIQTRENYLKRHLANKIEKHLIDNLIISPSLLSYYITWGNSRMLLINSSSAKIGDAEYFNKIYKLIKNEDVIKSLYKYFSDINCDGFKNEPLPKTEYSEDIKKSNKHPIVLYLENYVLENWVDDKTIVKDKSINTKEILLKNIFKNFNDWKGKSNITFEISNIKFALFLKKINVNGIKLLGHTNQGNKYEFDLDKMKTYFKIEEIQIENDEIGKIDELDNP
jgi:hypothetical protein